MRQIHDPRASHRVSLTQLGTALFLLAASACSGEANGDAAAGGMGGTASATAGQPGTTAGNGGSGGSTTPTGGSGGASDSPMTYRSKVAYADGQYIALGTREHTTQATRGFVLRSTDASNWKLVHQGDDEYLTTITHTEDAWFAAGAVFDKISQISTPVLLRSNDGVAWAPLSAPANVSSIQEIFWSGKLLLAVTRDADYSQQLFYSADGAAWTKHASNAPLTGFVRRADFVFGAQNGSVFRSADAGSTFTEVSLPSTPSLTSIAGLWSTRSGLEGTAAVICCFGEVPPTVYTLSSSDGIDWTVAPAVRPVPREAVERDGLSVGIEYSSSALIYRAPDSETWSNVEGVRGLSSIAVGERFVAVGYDAISFSDDGVNWLPAESVEEPE